MSDDDVSREDAPAETNVGLRRRAVLGGAVGVVGAALGVAGTAAAANVDKPGVGGADPQYPPVCDGCRAEPYCCNPDCVPHCWHCPCGRA